MKLEAKIKLMKLSFFKNDHQILKMIQKLKKKKSVFFIHHDYYSLLLVVSFDDDFSLFSCFSKEK